MSLSTANEEENEMNKSINIIGRAYEYSSVTGGPAPYPDFDPLCINERNIPHEERYKEADAEIRGGEGVVEWLTQESDVPSEEFNAEIIRAFKANGLSVGSTIDVSYGCRDTGFTEFYTLDVE